MRRDAVNVSGIMVCGEVRRGTIHSVTMELTGKARELADKKMRRFHASFSPGISMMIRLCSSVSEPTV